MQINASPHRASAKEVMHHSDLTQILTPRIPVLPTLTACHPASLRLQGRFESWGLLRSPPQPAAGDKRGVHVLQLLSRLKLSQHVRPQVPHQRLLFPLAMEACTCRSVTLAAWCSSPRISAPFYLRDGQKTDALQLQTGLQQSQHAHPQVTLQPLLSFSDRISDMRPCPLRSVPRSVLNAISVMMQTQLHLLLSTDHRSSARPNLDAWQVYMVKFSMRTIA